MVIKTILLFIWLLTVLSYISFAQQTITIENAEQVIILDHPEPTKILKGNVHIRHQKTHLWADSITIFDKDSAIAIGNVRFSIADTIFCSGANRLTYNKKLLIATGNITVSSKQNTIRTSYFTYDLQNQRALAINITWITQSGQITAKHLHISGNTFVFTDSVRAQRNETYSLSDTLILNQETNKYVFSGNVLIAQDKDSIQAKQVIAFPDKQEIFIGSGIHSDSLLWIADKVIIDTNTNMMKNALVKRDSLLLAGKQIHFYNNQLDITDTFTLLICRAKEDSILISGKRLKLDSSQQKGLLINGIIKQGEISMWADSIRMIDSVIILRPNGWISLNDWFITGDEIFIHKTDSPANKQFDSIVVYGNAWMIKPLDSIHTNQLTSPKIIIHFFEKDSITIFACCPVKTVFYNTNDKGKITSVNYTEGNRLTALFNNDSLQNITMYSNLSGYIEENAVANLKGQPAVFKPYVTTPVNFWMNELNPLSKHLFSHLKSRLGRVEER